jgi:sulfite reductase (ferredoxin)
VEADEICDAPPLAIEASRMLAENADFYNLPRKFKISITGAAYGAHIRKSTMLG